MVTAVRAAVRVLLVVCIIFPIGWVQSCLQWLLPRPAFYVFPQWLCQGVLWALGIRMEVRGAPSMDRPVLFVANHASYLDIVVLQSVIKGSFISKSEVARWPVFGWLAKLQKSIFIHRTRGDTRNQTEAISERLNMGGNLILFPEGTTGDGSRILPVKSSLLGVASLARAVQPVTIAFTALDGLPPGRTFRYLYSWIGDESLPPHMKRILTMGDMTLTVTFHPPITDGLDDRKALARRIEDALREDLNRALTGTAA